jgi:pimeloyl-ACP methyl ester carboxylesterase
MPSTQFYTWQGYSCAYEVLQPPVPAQAVPLLMIHPIGVGLSRRFWDRFSHTWFQSGQRNPIYNPDLLGCGESTMPPVAYFPEDWADQLLYFLQTVVQQPVIVVVQGALTPVALLLAQKAGPERIQAMILSDPPAQKVMTQATSALQRQISWNLFRSPLGAGFYRYARRRQFLQSFSSRQLFAQAENVDAEWLNTLEAGATDLNSRYAVFSFLAGFWRRNWQDLIAGLHVPTLVILGDTATSISKSGQSETSQQRMQYYLQTIPTVEGKQIKGRNILPYESTHDFVEAMVPFVHRFHD